MLMSFDSVDAVTVDRLNGMIDGGTPQDPMGDVAISFMALSAFDGMYIEVGSRLLIDTGYSSVDWSYTPGFGIEEMTSTASLQGTFLRTGTFEASFDSSNARGSATFHVVEPVGAVLTLLAARLVIPALPYLLSFAAGAMLYVVVEELIPEMSQGKHSNIGTIFFAVGFSIMMTLDVALG